MTLIDLLLRQAERHPDRPAFTFLVDGESEGASITFGQLDARARHLGAWLQTRLVPGDRAVLAYPPGLEFIEAFFGCLYAGVLPVIVSPPDPLRRHQTLPVFLSIVENADAALILTSSSYSEMGGGVKEWVETDRLESSAENWKNPRIRPESPALLQYTSGTTASAKGVILTHQNILQDLRLIQEICRYTQKDRLVAWIPHHHNLGLIGTILTTVEKGFSCWLMSPSSFLELPARWLRAITKYRGTISVAPSFAYQLCSRLLTAEEREGLDLRSWRMATTGGEPIPPEILEVFSATFGPCGFRGNGLQPGYGLSEATSVVTVKAPEEALTILPLEKRALEKGRIKLLAPGVPGAQRLVGCGRVATGMMILIVDPKTQVRCPPGRVGEIWLAGPTVAQGYWRREEETEKTFKARLKDTGEGPFLRTGDLGFLHGGELFITGRLKDLIIIRGKNHHPQDIERTVAHAHPAIRPYGCAAFSVVSEGGQENLVVAAEVERRSADDGSERHRRRIHALPLDPKSVRSFNPEEVLTAIRRAVSERHGLQAHTILLVQAGSLEKTGSGKIRRQACRAAYLEGSLRLIKADILRETPEGRSPKPSLKVGIANILQVPSEKLDLGQSLSEWGLDSLTAFRIKNYIAREIGVEIPVEGLLAGRSVVELLGTSRRAGPSEANLHPAPPLTEFPLSRRQEALWFLYRAAPQSAAYNIYCTLNFRSEFDSQALERSLQALVDRHPLLRSTFYQPGERPLQRVGNSGLSLERIDASLWTDNQLRQWIEKEAERPIDLGRGPVFRAQLLTKSPEENFLLLTVHHIAVDFWSLETLIRELGSLYRSETTGQATTLSALNFGYHDFVGWETALLSSPFSEALRDYWQEELKGDLPILELPVDRPRPTLPTYAGALYPFKIDETVTRKLRDVARSENTTVFMTVLAAFQVFLQKHTGQNDILVGTPAVGRSRPEFEDIVGYFVNPVVIRSDLSRDPIFRSLLARVRSQVLSVLAHQDYPLSSLLGHLHPSRRPGRSPLFQATLSWETLRDPGKPLESNFPNNGVEISFGQAGAPSELDLQVTASDRSLEFVFQYNTDLFEKDTIVRMAERFQVLLEGIARDTDYKISNLPLLPDWESKRILGEWNHSEGPIHDKELLHRLFERQVGETPHQIAVIDGGISLTYQELNARSNQLAHYLKREIKAPKPLVGLYLNRSPEMLVALLAVLKLGGAYVPLDPTLPRERLAYILKDSQVNAVLTQEKLQGEIPGEDVPIVSVDLVSLDGESEESFIEEGSPEDLAYVVYTSGSTGAPKGVMIEHRSVANYIRNAISEWGLGPKDRLLQFASFGFDASAEEIYSSLLSGATLVLRTGLMLGSPSSFLRQCNEWQLTVLDLPTAFWHELADALQGDALALPSAIRLVIIGGEKVERRRLEKWQKRVPASVRLVNTYGPTEATIVATMFDATRFEGVLPSRGVPIGRPVPGVQTYILGPDLEPVPIGVAGELHIGGAGLAKGYLKLPDLTHERFIPNPFRPSQDSRLYKTGDYARYLPDGNIEFLGRIDDQVKIRGFRVELGEIVSALSQHPQVKEAAVTAVEMDDGQKRLIAYVVANVPESPAVVELKTFLKGKLPVYMVPSSIVFVGKLPLTANGKVDRDALPAEPTCREAPTGEGGGPRDDLELQILRLWEDLLNVRPIRITDHFFDLGGNSLLALRLMARIQNEFGRDLPLSTVFEKPTIEELALILRQQDLVQGRSPLVRIRSSEGKSPFFCVHPGTGGVFCFAELSRHLGSGRPFYGFQAPGLDGERAPFTDCGDLAEHYIEALQEIQADGPYFLGGYCSGGIIALEMARRLEHRGREAFVALIDAPAPAIETPHDLEEADLLALFAMDLGARHGANLPFTQNPAGSSAPEDHLEKLLEQAKHHGVLPPDTSLRRLRTLFEVFKATFLMAQSHTPSFGGSRVVLFRAESGSLSNSDDTSLGWNAILDGPAEVIPVPGDHYSLLAQPHAKTLAERLEKWIDGTLSSLEALRVERRSLPYR